MARLLPPMFNAAAFVHNVPGSVTRTTLYATGFEPELTPIDPEVSRTSPPFLITKLFETPEYPTERVTAVRREPTPLTETELPLSYLTFASEQETQAPSAITSSLKGPR